MLTSLAFFDQRAGSGTINQARFHLVSDFTAGAIFEAMIPDSRDPIGESTTGNDLYGRNQFVVLKDITARVMFPICLIDNTPPPVQSNAAIRALFQEFTFRIRINDQTIWYPVSFVTNADTYKSQGILARFDSAVKTLEVDVSRDFVDGALTGQGWFEYLTLQLELFTFNS